MPNIDVIANVVVLVAAGVGAILALACALQLVRHRGRSNDSSRLRRCREWNPRDQFPGRRIEYIPAAGRFVTTPLAAGEGRNNVNASRSSHDLRSLQRPAERRKLVGVS